MNPIPFAVAAMLAASLLPAAPLLTERNFLRFRNADRSFQITPCNLTAIACVGTTAVPSRTGELSGTGLVLEHSIRSLADYGTLSAEANGTVHGVWAGIAPPVDVAILQAYAGFQDDLFFTSPDVTAGTAGTALFRFVAEGILSATPGNTAAIILEANNLTTGEHSFAASASPGEISVAIPIVFGQPQTIWLQFAAGSNISVWTSGSYATSDFYNTARLTSLTVNVGNEPGRVQVTSAAVAQGLASPGYLQVAAVPEPSSCLLVVSAAVPGLLWLRRRRPHS